MTLLLGALIAGILTTLAPCVLPLLPVIVGGAVPAPGDPKPWRRALIVTAALGASVVAFTLLLKATTVFLAIPATAWSSISGILLILLGLTAAFPEPGHACPDASAWRPCRLRGWPRPAASAAMVA